MARNLRTDIFLPNRKEQFERQRRRGILAGRRCSTCLEFVPISLKASKNRTILIKWRIGQWNTNKTGKTSSEWNFSLRQVQPFFPVILFVPRVIKEISLFFFVRTTLVGFTPAMFERSNKIPPTKGQRFGVSREKAITPRRIFRSIFDDRPGNERSRSRTSIAWNSKGNDVEATTEHDATRRLQQQLPQQRYLTYDICLNHDVVRLHKPVPEPEHGALYSSQASAR